MNFSGKGYLAVLVFRVHRRHEAGTRVLTSALDSSQMRADEGDESELGRRKQFVQEMKQNINSFGRTIGSWIGCVVSLIVLAGCSSTPVEKTPSKTAAVSPQAPQVPDESWPADAYVLIGMPDPGRRWTAKDYGNCRDILYRLDRTNRTALPRSESLKSGVLFARLINPTNTLLLGDQFLPSEVRGREFITILNRYSAFRDIYRFDTRGPLLLREMMELNHAFLRMLGSAVEWDGKPLPLAPGEKSSVTFRLSESLRTYSESLLNLPASQSAVPRGERFIVVGAYTAVTLGFLPWVADGTELGEADRLKTIRYLRADLPVLWPHVSTANQREFLGNLDEILRRTRHEEIRRNLAAFRQELASIGGSKSPE